MNPSQCPNCGALNRPSARFCQKCRAPLHPNVTMKACPQCNAPNRVDAKFCAKCRHPVSVTPKAGSGSPLSRFPSASNIPILAALAGIAILVVCLLVSTVFIVLLPKEASPTRAAQMQPATPSIILPVATRVSFSPTGTPVTTAPVVPVTGDLLDRAKRGTVRIIVPLDSDPNRVITGSGSVITKQGHILTNNHLFRDDNGRPYNSRGEIYIAFPPRNNLKGNAEVFYRAVMVRADAQNDLAVVRVSARRDGRPLPADLELAVLSIGDSEKLDSGDQVTILGYPGLGGDSLTLTSGRISGFLQDEGYIKTDALIYPGNSGGGALNAAYELIGVASARSLSRTTSGQLGLIRPLKIAQPLIDSAKQDAGE